MEKATAAEPAGTAKVPRMPCDSINRAVHPAGVVDFVNGFHTA